MLLVNLAVSRARPTRPFLGHTRDFHFFGIGWGPTGGEACWIGYTTLNAFVRCVSVGFVVKGSDGFYKSWGMKDAQRREDCRIFGIFPDFVAGELPPWRLSKPQEKIDGQPRQENVVDALLRQVGVAGILILDENRQDLESKTQNTLPTDNSTNLSPWLRRICALSN